MPTLDDHIGAQLREAQRKGELEQAPSYGKPMAFDDGYMETPEELRMAYKALKDAGFVPAEVEMFHQVAALRQQLATTTGEDESRALRQRMSELQQRIALRLERLRTTGDL